jgi:hypothetical protein
VTSAMSLTVAMATVRVSHTITILLLVAHVSSFIIITLIECHGSCHTCKNESSNACYSCDEKRNFLFNSTLRPITWTAT